MGATSRASGLGELAPLVTKSRTPSSAPFACEGMTLTSNTKLYADVLKMLLQSLFNL